MPANPKKEAGAMEDYGILMLGQVWGCLWAAFKAVCVCAALSCQK